MSKMLQYNPYSHFVFHSTITKLYIDSASIFSLKRYNIRLRDVTGSMIVDLRKTGRTRHWWVGMVTCLSLFLILTVPVSAYAAGAISQGFQTTDKSATTGNLLSYGPKQGFVELATNANVANLAGVSSTGSLIELSGTGKNVQVVVSGLTQTLVTSANGPIVAGDKITASPFAGVGMKATNPTEIVGVAQASLNSVKTLQETVVDKTGKKETITVGLIPMEVNVAYFASSQSGTSSLFVPPFLQSIANAIAGSEVSPLRVLASALTLVLGFTTVSIILYTSIRASITAIGRNPLANTAVRKGLVDVLVMAAGILAVTLVTMYIVVGG
jgi:hypothetical protein